MLLPGAHSYLHLCRTDSSSVVSLLRGGLPGSMEVVLRHFWLDMDLNTRHGNAHSVEPEH